MQHAPYLARGQLGSLTEPLSSIQYKTDTRTELLEAAAGLMDVPPPLGHDGAKFEGYDELARLNEDVLGFRDLPRSRQAQVLSCLNCMTEHRVALSVMPALSSAYFADADGCCALYEGARTLVRVRPQDQQSRRVLDRLSRQEVNPRMATAAAVQLGAASIRLDHDLDAGARALEVADLRRGEVDRTTSSFVGTLLDSRYFRALSLLALKRREFGLLASAMDQAMESADALMAQTTPSDPYPRLVARENMRLVVEVHLVAATGAEKPAQFARWAARLLELDPEDPYTWQYLAVYGARCGCAVEAALAASGLAAIGGLDFAEVTEAIRSGRVNQASDTGLVQKILGTLEAILQPGAPSRSASAA
jgi:hypothetical protein